MFPREPLAAGVRRVTFRLALPADTGFLREIYGSTREAELAPVPWTPEQKNAFIAHQFAAQTDAYTKNYPGAEFLVIAVDDRNAGRLYLHERADEIRIMDVALLPPFRNLGIGSAVLRRVLDQGLASHRCVSIHVEVFNLAMRLYERLGFTEVSRTEVYALMEWRLPTQQPN